MDVDVKAGDIDVRANEIIFDEARGECECEIRPLFSRLKKT